MIHICIPTRDEDRTIGVLLWKIREVMLDLGRDYRICVLDDGSTDGTRALLDRYRRVLPLTVLREARPIGYGPAVEKLLRTVAASTEYPKRDAVVVMQGDFTEHPDDLRSIVKTFEGGADIVAGNTGDGEPKPPWSVRLARRIGAAALGRRGTDPMCGFRAYRAVVVQKALNAAAGRPLVTRAGWAANAQLLAALAPFARRVAQVPVGLRYDIRRRRSRVRVLPTVFELLRLRKTSFPAALLLASISVALAAAPRPVQAQAGTLLMDSLSAPARSVSRIPFELGEHLRYKVKVFAFSVGEGRMSVPRIDTVHGAPAYAAEWHIQGGALGYKIDSKFYSWMDTETLVSRRFLKDQHEGGRKRYREYDFFPEERRWHRLDYDSVGSLPTSLPLDDVSFVYFARTLPLEVGKTYTFNRYFKDDGNPVVLHVVRKDRRKVGAGEFNTIVIRPVIRTRGLFSEGGEAEIHLSDDDRRLIVYMKSNLPLVGTLSLHLEEIVAPSSEEPPEVRPEGPPERAP